MRRFTPSEKHCKSYKTIANLDKALAKLDLETLNHIVFTFPSGRVTAIFSFDACLTNDIPPTTIVMSGFSIWS